MPAKRIIPCLDITGGRVVKGVRFVELRDAGDPVSVAQAYEAQGADELTFLDITASSDGRDTLVDVVRAVAQQVFMPLTVGGGLRTPGDVRRMLQAGADKVSLNTAAILNPDLIDDASRQFGAQCIVLAIDARRNADGRPGWTVYTHGGRKPTALDAVAWAREGVARGAGEILLTSMDCDGTKNGYDLALTRAIAERTAIFWSTSRNELWEKGKTSGETFDLLEVRVNCEQNSLVYVVRPRRGGICHTKNRAGQPRNCYYRRLDFDTGQLVNLDP